MQGFPKIGAAVLGVLVLLAGVIGAGYLWLKPSPQPTTTFALTPTQPPAVREIKVHVAGEVLQPGLYSFKENERVADALQAAGGPTEQADVNLLNLAAPLKDGQRLMVGPKGAAPGSSAEPASRPSTTSRAAGSQLGGATTTVSLNSATLAELDTLEGIGPITAQKIIDYRERNGGFRSIEEVKNISGIGEAKFQAIRARLTL